MTLFGQTEERGGNRAVFASAGLHVLAFWGLMLAPAVELPKRSPSEYQQILDSRPERKITVYKFRKELPPVAPPKSAKADKRPLRADVKSNQAIVSSAKAEKRTQMVWTPAPDLAPTVPLESPNLIAVKLPEPGPKPFTAPPDIVRPPVAEVKMPAPPEMGAAQPLAQPELKSRRLAREYRAPAPARKVAKSVAPLEAAPEIAAMEMGPATMPGVRTLPKLYKAPTLARGTAWTVTRVGDAPEVAPSPALVAGAAMPGAKLPPKMFPGVPGTGRGANRAVAVTMDAPEPLDMAVVGLKPAEVAVSLPAASSPASFASGPKLNPKGAASEAGAAGLAVPDLFVRGPKPTGAADLIAQARLAPTSREMVAAAIRQGEPVMTRTYVRPASPGSAATKVMSAPDPRMAGREVYMMAIQMPNLTSYSGSWLMWYAARTASAVAEAPLAAPVAHRKVDPKYVQAAVDERVQGNVRLACEIDMAGNVSRVELLQGLDARLNQTAAEALAKWQFYPATRNGEPVAVDVVVEIPFRLAPQIGVKSKP